MIVHSLARSSQRVRVMTEETVGRYRLYRRLAAGGMGEVYLAGQSGPGGFEKLVVLKRMLPEMAASPELVDLFLDEARLMARLSHRNIPPVIELGEDAGGYFTALEFVRGPTLAHLLEDGPLPPALAVDICAELAETLAYAHAAKDRDGSSLRIVHRDVSPANILVSTTGEVKLIDFGIARSACHKGYDDRSALKGKLGYMSPEQTRGEELDGRSDLFALGIVFYEMLTGENPFLRPTQFSTLAAIQNESLALPKADPWIALCAPVLRKLLEKDRDARFQDGLAAQEALLSVRGRMSRPPLRLSAYVAERFDRPLANLLAAARTQLPIASPERQTVVDLRDLQLAAVDADFETRPGLRKRPSPIVAAPDQPLEDAATEAVGASPQTPMADVSRSFAGMAEPTSVLRARNGRAPGLAVWLTISALCLSVSLWLMATQLNRGELPQTPNTTAASGSVASPMGE